jgi:hypothetical protein
MGLKCRLIPPSGVELIGRTISNPILFRAKKKSPYLEDSFSINIGMYYK